MTVGRLLPFVLLVLIAALCGQDEEKEPKEEKKPSRQVRFLAVGDLPPYRQEIRDGVAYELEPPPGSIPPRELIVGSGGDDAAEARLLLNQVSEGFKIPAGAGPLMLRYKGDNDQAEPWLRLQRPEEGDMLVILWRSDGIKGTWAKPLSLVLPDGPEQAPAGRIRLLNVSPVTVGVVMGGEKIALLAGKSFERPIPQGKDVPFQLGAVDAKGELRRFYSGSALQNPGERTLVVVYRADGTDPRSDLKANVMREPVAQSP
jgi:hypothetical protein